jgi:hypothetical protein
VVRVEVYLAESQTLRDLYGLMDSYFVLFVRGLFNPKV